MKRRITRAMALPVLVVFVALGATVNTGVAAAHGCTPGYYKNHVATNENVTLAAAFPGAKLGAYSSLTLKQALSLKGGPGMDGALQILLRHAAAAYLNATAPFIYSGPSVAQLQYSVSYLTNSGDRDDILFYAEFLDQRNSSGCPNPYASKNDDGSGGSKNKDHSHSSKHK